MAYGQSWPKRARDSTHRCLNLHASLLPHIAVRAPSRRRSLRGDAETGITVIYMDEVSTPGTFSCKPNSPFRLTRPAAHSTIVSRSSHRQR